VNQSIFVEIPILGWYLILVAADLIWQPRRMKDDAIYTRAYWIASIFSSGTWLPAAFEHNSRELSFTQSFQLSFLPSWAYRCYTDYNIVCQPYFLAQISLIILWTVLRRSHPRLWTFHDEILALLRTATFCRGFPWLFLVAFVHQFGLYLLFTWQKCKKGHRKNK
jgi:hypothetical protein